MKYQFAILLGASLACVALPHASAYRLAERQSSQDWSEQDRIDQTYRLAAGTHIELSTIYGPVDVETSDSDSAEVHIVRYARSREDLTSRKISIELTAKGLAIRGEKDHSEEPMKVRHRVIMRVPRNVDLSAERINGHLNVGEVNGTVSIHRINGAVRVDRAGGHADVSQVNGSLQMTLAQLVPQGLDIKRINGTVNLRFAADLNADLAVAEFNGAVNVNMPNTSILHKVQRQAFRARIGSGGPPISISDVNGSVRLDPAG
jgi:DUF4097 and DUF4098 domain-containing protein YvlB